jgi:hypothetical protein
VPAGVCRGLTLVLFFTNCARPALSVPGAACRSDPAQFGLPRGLKLLTEQLIRYSADDGFFNLHWDIDAVKESDPLPEVTGSEMGPGCVIATLNLRSAATLMLQPRCVHNSHSSTRVARKHTSALPCAA